MSSRGVEIDVGAFVIEMHAHVRITLCRFDNRGVERGASDRVDAFVRIDIVGRKMQRAGFIMNHPAAHRDRVLQCFVGDPDLFERMNAARRNRQIDRASADDVAFARISAPLVKIDIVSAPSQICREQSARESAADQNKLRHSTKNLRIRKRRKAGKSETMPRSAASKQMPYSSLNASPR